MALRSHSQKKPQQSVSPPVQNQLRSRPFVIPAQPETSQPETPDLQTQLETAQRFGHSFSKISAAIIQPKLIAKDEMTGDRQEASEEQRSTQTGLPDRLKTGIENLSGYSMDDVRVHYNSPQPAQLNALAYTQGSDIHVAAGQEKHLPHEAWHVVQQKQGKVKPIIQAGGVAINDDVTLEREAVGMGEKAYQGVQATKPSRYVQNSDSHAPVQMYMEWLIPIAQFLGVEASITAVAGAMGIESSVLITGISGLSALAVGGTVSGLVYWFVNRFKATNEPKKPAPSLVQDLEPTTKDSTSKNLGPTNPVTDLKLGNATVDSTLNVPSPLAPSVVPEDKSSAIQAPNPKVGSDVKAPDVPAPAAIEPPPKEGKQEVGQAPSPVVSNAKNSDVSAPVVIEPPPKEGKQEVEALGAAPTSVVPDVEVPASALAPTAPKKVIPKCVELSQQTKGKTLGQMIQLPEGVTTGEILYRVKGGRVPTLNTHVLGAGIHQVEYRYQAASTAPMEEVFRTELHIKPTIDDLMTKMGFVSRSWRRELKYGTHGTLGKDFHLTVPMEQQTLPDRMDNEDAILAGIFPPGAKGKLDGTHMTIECRQGGNSKKKKMNNAAFYLTGEPKYPQGYTRLEQEEFTNACETKLNKWKTERKQKLREALKALGVAE